MFGNAILKRKLKRLEISLAEAERLLEERSRELYRVNRNLERVIEIRTRDFQSAKEAAEKANKAKSQFLANMSHEIRTPLNGIIGFIDILMKSNLSEVQKEQLEIVQSSGDFLLQIISDILEFSKIEAGKLNVEEKPFHLKRCIEAIAANLAIAVYKKGLKFNLFIDESIPKNLVGDEGRIRQVLLNLIGNAIKYTPSGSIGLKILCNKTEEGPYRLDFYVSDTGVGIAEDKLESIFLPFEQADVSDTRRYGGTGLGLAISRQLVRALGGDLTVESKEAKGSVFSFSLLMNLPKGEPAQLTTRDFKNKETVFIVSAEMAEVEGVIHRLKSWNANVQYFSKLDQLPRKVSQNESLNILLNPSSQVGLPEDIDKIKRMYPWAKIILSKNPDRMEAAAELAKKENIVLLQKPIIRKSLFDAIDIKATFISKVEISNSPIPAKPLATSTKGSQRILVVEDNLINQKLISVMLMSFGHQIEIAENGEEAVQKMAQGEFDIILMDCQMPVMNGFEATKILRAKGVIIPIIALTANAFKQTKEEAFDAGMTDFLTKPMKVQDVEEMLNKYIA